MILESLELLHFSMFRVQMTSVIWFQSCELVAASLSWFQLGLTHRCCGRCVDVKKTANIWPRWVDGLVQAELLWVHAQVGAAFLHHLTQDIHLYLWKHTTTHYTFYNVLKPKKC